MTEKRPVAIVTGAAGGIGLEIATRLERRGYDVFAVDLDLAPLRDATSAHLEAIRLDVTDEPGIHALVERIRAEKGRVDLLVNNAGISQPGVVECVPVDLARRQLEVNVFGYVRFIQAVLPVMRSQRSGRVINLTSALGKVSVPGLGWYAASKHAIEALSDALRDEVRPFGIHVVVIEPGVVDTALPERQNALLAKVSHPEAYAKVVDSIVNGIGGFGGAKPSVIAEAVVRAASAARPPIRRAVPLDAKLFINARRLLGDRLVSWLVRKRSGLG